MEYGCREKASFLTEKNESWRVTQGQRSNHRELSFNPTVTRRAHTREPGTKAATALGILRPPGAMVQQPLGAGENQGPPTITCEKATVATPQLSKIS